MRNRVTLAVVAVAMLLGGSGALPAGAADRPADVSVIAVLEPGSSVAATAARLATQHGGRAPRIFEHVLGGFQFVGPAAAVDGLSRAPGVRAVVSDDRFSLVDVAGFGFFRIDAEVSTRDSAGPYRGAGTRVAVIDSGVDTDHPDLTPNLDLAHAYNCVAPGTAPEDDNGHGTHVAGIAAAAFNDYGLEGVAPKAEILPLKAFDASGNGTTAWILCALDRLAEVVTASPMPTALNLSFADVGGDSACDDGDVTDALHEALCDAVDAGTAAGAPVVPVAAAGNDDVNVGGTIPAAFHDVITVSGLADHDGVRGGTAGCKYVALLFNYECDDTLASFSNFGTAVDVAAPGVNIYSTVPGSHGNNSGTSMSAPHVAGVVAAVLGEHGTLDTAGVRSLLLRTGECPDGSPAGPDGSCAGQGSWQKTANRTFFEPTRTEADPDGVAEPVVNAGRAASEADAMGTPPPPPPSDGAPVVAVTQPAAGATVSGTVTIVATATDDVGVAGVEVFVDDVSIGAATLEAGAWRMAWDTTAAADGTHVVEAVATDTSGQTSSASRSVDVDNVPAPGPTLHVGELSGAATSGRRWTASAEVRVVDGSGTGVSGVTVSFSFANLASVAAKGGTSPGGGGGGGGGGSTGGALSCVTATDGRCRVSTQPSATSVRFTVTNVAKGGAAYDASRNVDGDPATAATDIVVAKP
jgi:subtilisin